MADRSRNPAGPGHAAAATTAAASSAPSRRGISRNLFKSHLTRRPTPAANAPPPSTTNGNTAAQTMRRQSPHAGIHSDDAVADAELVVRDMHGEIEIGELPLPGLLDDGDDALLHDQEETKKERQRLAEAVKQHQVNRSTTVTEQPEAKNKEHPADSTPKLPEVLEDLKRSLKANVLALDNDRWMYEPGDFTLRR